MNTGGEGELSFEQDVKPLFRERDRSAMLNVAKFDLWKREDVAEHSDAILGTLEAGSCPAIRHGLTIRLRSSVGG